MFGTAILCFEKLETKYLYSVYKCIIIVLPYILVPVATFTIYMGRPEEIAVKRSCGSLR